jgi:hypothetical protein
LTLSDRVAVIYEGEIMGVLELDELDIQLIGLMMAGTCKEDALLSIAERAEQKGDHGRERTAGGRT